MSKTKELVKGSILSESSFYVVKEIQKDNIVATDEAGNDIILSNEYVDGILKSADSFETTKDCNKTQLADLLLNNPRTAMTVAFYKTATEKSAKAFKEEKAAAIARVQSARTSDVEKLLSDLIDNPITRTIPGELRVMKGRHNGSQDELGRVQFIDMEQPKVAGVHDNRLRQVDPRSISYIILDNVKHILK